MADPGVNLEHSRHCTRDANGVVSGAAEKPNLCRRAVHHFETILSIATVKFDRSDERSCRQDAVAASISDKRQLIHDRSEILEEVGLIAADHRDHAGPVPQAIEPIGAVSGLHAEVGNIVGRVDADIGIIARVEMNSLRRRRVVPEDVVARARLECHLRRSRAAQVERINTPPTDNRGVVQSNAEHHYSIRAIAQRPSYISKICAARVDDIISRCKVQIDVRQIRPLEPHVVVTCATLHRDVA